MGTHNTHNKTWHKKPHNTCSIPLYINITMCPLTLICPAFNALAIKVFRYTRFYCIAWRSHTRYVTCCQKGNYQALFAIIRHNCGDSNSAYARGPTIRIRFLRSSVAWPRGSCTGDVPRTPIRPSHANCRDTTTKFGRWSRLWRIVVVNIIATW